MPLHSQDSLKASCSSFSFLLSNNMAEPLGTHSLEPPQRRRSSIEPTGTRTELLVEPPVSPTQQQHKHQPTGFLGQPLATTTSPVPRSPQRQKVEPRGKNRSLNSIYPAFVDGEVVKQEKAMETANKQQQHGSPYTNNSASTTSENEPTILVKASLNTQQQTKVVTPTTAVQERPSTVPSNINKATNEKYQSSASNVKVQQQLEERLDAVPAPDISPGPRKPQEVSEKQSVTTRPTVDRIKELDAKTPPPDSSPGYSVQTASANSKSSNLIETKPATTTSETATATNSRFVETTPATKATSNDSCSNPRVFFLGALVLLGVVVAVISCVLIVAQQQEGDDKAPKIFSSNPPSSTPTSSPILELSYPPKNHSELLLAVQLYVGEESSAAIVYNGKPMEEWDVSRVQSLDRLFFRLDNFNIDIHSWDVSRVTSMEKTFQDASTFNQDLSQWNVSRVQTLKQAFQNAKHFDQDLSSWDTSRVTNMDAVFTGAANLAPAVLRWDTSSVTSMLHIFSGATHFNADLMSWNTSSLLSLADAFVGAVAFNQNLQTWDVSRVTSFINTFYSASNYNQPLESWNMSSAKTLSGMFVRASKWNQPLDKWDVAQVTDLANMFSGATAFNQGLSSWNVSQVTSFENILRGATSFNQSLCSWAARMNEKTNVDDMFLHTSCPSVTKNISNFVSRQLVKLSMCQECK